MHHGNRHILSIKIETCPILLLSSLTPPSLRTPWKKPLMITSSPRVVFCSNDRHSLAACTIVLLLNSFLNALQSVSSFILFQFYCMCCWSKCSPLFQLYEQDVMILETHPIQTWPTTINTPLPFSQILGSQAWTASPISSVLCLQLALKI